MEANPIAKYFDTTPAQWGLRGDPLLWEEMKIKFAETAPPGTADQLKDLLKEAFTALTGQPPVAGKMIHVEKYPKLGMSGGMVSCDFWLQKAFPLIIERYQAGNLNAFSDDKVPG